MPDRQSPPIDEKRQAPPPPSSPSTGDLLEPMAAFFLATACASALFWIGHSNSVVGDNLHAAIAVIFLYAPAAAARLTRRPFDYRAAGLRADPVGSNLSVTALGLLITWPIFFVAFLIFYSQLCKADSPLALYWIEMFAPVCPRWLGLDGASFQLPDGFAILAASQLVVVAIPEELFFRGYLLTRLEERWPSTRRLWGAPVGWPLLVSAALFALGHFLVNFEAQRLTVFFPGLVFGWMRARTGSIGAGALYHALCNLFSDVLHTSFFR